MRSCDEWRGNSRQRAVPARFYREQFRCLKSADPFLLSGKEEDTMANEMTKADFQKLQDELDDRKLNLRKEISEKIKEAREQGDLSENAEYDAARDEQRDNEARIEELEAIIKDAVVINEEDVDLTAVNVGSTVKIKDLDTDEELTFDIVGSAAVDSLNFKISTESPLGREMTGHHAGDKFTVENDGEDFHYQILEVERNREEE
jgi:transcription elongation factor GreA